MKHFTILSFIAACALGLGGCDTHHHSKSLSDGAEQLTEQFRSQHDSKPQASPARKLKSVQITGFSFPSGNPHPYLGVGVAWEGTDTINYTGIPMVQLGDGLFGVTYETPDTKEELSAVLSFK